MTMKRCIFCLLLFWTIPTASAQETMRIEDAVRIGLRSNYDIQVARNTKTISQRSIGLGRADFLPTVNFSNNFQLNRSDQSTNSPFAFGNSNTRSFGSQVSLNWTVFDGFRMFNNTDRYEKLSRLGAIQTKVALERTVVEIFVAYFNLVRQEQLLDVLHNARNVSNARLQKEQVRNDLGGTSSTDIFNAQVAYNNDRANVLDQELTVVIAKQQLNILLGRDPETEVVVAREITVPVQELSYQEILERTLKQNNRLLVARQNTSVSEESVRLSRSSLYPVVTLNSSYGYANRRVSAPQFDLPITTRSRDGGIGITVSYNIFNGKRDRISLQNARAEAYNTELIQRNTELEIRGLVQEKYVTLQKRLELIDLEAQNVQTAEQNLALQQEKYALGASTSIEFRDAQVNLIRAQATLINARFQARIAHTEIRQLIGAIPLD
jgi:outer membrane protein